MTANESDVRDAVAGPTQSFATVALPMMHLSLLSAINFTFRIDFPPSAVIDSSI
jgi:hypothetical protein